MQRLSVSDAARQLGLSESAVRSRIFRGTLAHEKDSNGSVWALLPDEAYDQSPHNPNELVAVLQDQVQYLRERLNAAEERDRENRRIIAALTQRIPELEAPPEAREARVSASETPGSTKDRDRRRKPFWAFWVRD